MGDEVGRKKGKSNAKETGNKKGRRNSEKPIYIRWRNGRIKFSCANTIRNGGTYYANFVIFIRSHFSWVNLFLLALTTGFDVNMDIFRAYNRVPFSSNSKSTRYIIGV